MPVGRGGGVKSTPCPPSPLPMGALSFPQFRSHQETNMAARRTVNDRERSTPTISRKNRGL